MFLVSVKTMAGRQQMEIVPQVGTHSGGESHSSQEEMPVDSGEGNSQLFFQEPAEAETGTPEVFARSSLTRRSPPGQESSTTTSLNVDMLDRVHRSVETGDVNLDISGLTQESVLEAEMTLPTDSSLLNPVHLVTESTSTETILPAKVRRQLLKERKEAEGTWLPKKEWRRSQGLAVKKRKRAEGNPNRGGSADGVSPLRRDLPKTGRVAPKANESSVAKRPRRWDQRPAQTAGGAAGELSFREQLTCSKMAVVPAAYPEVRLTDEECTLLQEKLVEMVFGGESSTVSLQILKTYGEKGALVVTCGNDETKTWLRDAAPNLGFGVAGEREVIVGDYRDLLRTTKVLLRTDKFLAGKDAKLIVAQVAKQNPGISTGDWRIINSRREEDHQTLVLAVDEVNAQVLKERGWRIFLGITRVQLKVLSGSPADDEGPASEPAA